MSGYIEGTDRGQMTLFPDRLEDWIGEDNPVRNRHGPSPARDFGQPEERHVCES